MREKTPGDSEILRHEAKEREWQPPAAESAGEEVAAHFEKHLGKVDSVFHEILSDLIHLDVQIIKPTPERNHYTLFTTGMSDLPMTVPEGAEEHRYAELMLALPPHWKLTDADLEDERWYWPIRTLKMLGRLPHQYETWLSLGHTVPNGDPAEPYAEGTRLCCALLLPSLHLPEDARAVKTQDGRTIHLYALHFLHPEEIDLKLQKGSGALYDAFDAQGVSEVLDPARPSAVSRKKLFGLF